jgi:hypothetical protein
MKYREDENLKKALEYVAGTYGQHYVGVDPEETQILDLLHSLGIAEQFCQGNAVKYASRFGRKTPAGSKEAEKDLLKAIHYCLLLLHFSSGSKGESEELSPEAEDVVYNVIARNPDKLKTSDKKEGYRLYSFYEQNE